MARLNVNAHGLDNLTDITNVYSPLGSTTSNSTFTQNYNTTKSITPNATTTATWTIDVSQAEFVNNGIFAKENKGDFKTWCEGDYDERVRLMNEAFFDAFNLYSPGMELVKEGDAPYHVVLKVDTFERGQGPGVMGSCYMSVIDNATGEQVLEVAVNNVKGDTDFVENDRFPKTMTWFCRDLFKLKK